VVYIPTSAKESVEKDLQRYGEAFKKKFAEQHKGSAEITFSVKRVHGRDIADAVNSQRNIETLFYFGHGYSVRPLFEYTNRDKTDFADADQFQADRFAPDAVAVWAGCNSADYAKAFAQQTGVLSIGTKGPAFYDVPAKGIRAARKGLFDDSAAEMWMFS